LHDVELAIAVALSGALGPADLHLPSEGRRVMRAIITIVISAATMVGVSPALADCGSSDKPVQVGFVSGNPEQDTFGLLCSRDIEQTGSITGAITARVMQVGTSTGDPEKDSFGYAQTASAQ
jgi:hypothetical protein